MRLFLFSSILCFIIAILIAGNWLYNPFQLINNPIEDYRPQAIYPLNDNPQSTYNSEYIYIPSQDTYYIEYSYIWLNISSHTPDTEQVRIYIKNNSIHHLSFMIHYQWMDIYEFKTNGTHPLIEFSPIYHTPMISLKQYIETGIIRIFPIVFFVILGIILIIISKGGKK